MDTVVYRGGFWENMLGPISPLIGPPSRRSLGQNMLRPLPNRPGVFFTSLSANLGVPAQNILGPAPTPSSPPQCFSLPSLQAWNKTCLGPPHPAVIFTLVSVVWGPTRWQAPVLLFRRALAMRTTLACSCKNTISKVNYKPFLQERLYMSFCFTD